MSVIDLLLKKGYGAFTLPSGSKYPPPRGWTGSAQRVTEDMIYEELSKEAAGECNIGMVLPVSVVGIDVDSTVTPQASVIEAETRAGWRISARGGKGRYTALYALPEGVRAEDLSDVEGVDLIRHSHRYTVVHGTHPSGSQYRVYAPSGHEVDIALLPDAEELPILSMRVVEVMKRPVEREVVSTEGLMEEACTAGIAVYRRGMELLHTGEKSMHTALRDTLYALSETAIRGHRVGNLPERAVESFIASTGPLRASEGYRLMERLSYPASSCTCNRSDRSRVPASRATLTALTMTEEEALSTLYIHTHDKHFPSAPQREAYERKTLKNLSIDALKKEAHREEAERKWIGERRVSHESSERDLMELVESLSMDRTERQVLWMLGHGYKDAEIADLIHVSRSTVSRVKRKVKQNNKERVTT